MDIKVGDIVKYFSNEKDFSIKKIVKNWVVLESSDRKEQILTGAHNLKGNSFCMKKDIEPSFSPSSRSGKRYRKGRWMGLPLSGSNFIIPE